MLADILLIGAILIAGCGLFRHVRDVIDVDVFDETHYLHRGDSIADAFRTPDNGPLYSLHYHLLGRLWHDKLDIYYVNYVTLTVLLPCVLYVCLRSYRASRLTSVAAALLLLLCHGNFPLTPKVGHFALIILLAGLAIARRCRGTTRKLTLLLSAALVASYARPECFLAVAIFGVWLGVRSVRLARTRRLRPALPVIASAFLLLALALAVLGFPLQGSERSFMAFGQHYSLHSVAWHGANVDPWTAWTEIVDHDFHGARSVVSAASANPILFLRHIAYNVRDLLPNTVGSMLRLAFAPLSWVVSSFVAAAALAVVYRRRVIEAGRRTLRGTRELIQHRAVDGFGPLVLAVPSVVSVLVVYPRVHYILMAFGLLVVAVIAAHERASRGLAISSGNRAAYALVGILVALLWARPYTSVPPTRTLDVYTTIKFLRGLGAAEVKVVTPEGDYAAYLPKTVTIVNANELGRPLPRALEGIDVIVASETMRMAAAFSSDARRLFDDPSRFGFHPQPVAGLRRTTILVRDAK